MIDGSPFSFVANITMLCFDCRRFPLSIDIMSISIKSAIAKYNLVSDSTKKPSVVMSKQPSTPMCYSSGSSNSRCRLCLKICDANHSTNIFRQGNSHLLCVAELVGERRACGRRLNNCMYFKKLICDIQ